MYRAADYLWMLTDDLRVRAYSRAIAGVVRPGHRVLEIGAGFGFFSVLAVRAGAMHVDAVDTNPVVHLGPRVAEANGCAARISFHHDDCTRIELPRRADVLVSDLRGPTPFCGRSIATLIDARERLLETGGAIVAARDTMFVAASRAPAAFRDEVLAAHNREGVIMEPVERVVHDTPLRCTIAEADLLTVGRHWCSLDYATVTEVNHAGEAVWKLDRDVRVEGLAVWFETETAPGCSFSSAPGSGVRAYRQMFLPLRRPVAARARQSLRARLSAHLVGEDYLWTWEVALAEDVERYETMVRQNSLAELVVDPAAFGGRSTRGER